jgi:hypothetical protein
MKGSDPINSEANEEVEWTQQIDRVIGMDTDALIGRFFWFCNSLKHCTTTAALGDRNS